MERTCLLILIVATALCTRQDFATAAEYRSAATGNWHAAVSWEVLVGGTWQPATTPPKCGDTATILSGHIITVNCTSSSITALSVAAGGKLEIDGCSSTQRAVLTVCGSGAEPSVSIVPTDGLQLMDRFSELRFEASATISGRGSLRGRDSDAAITVVAASGQSTTLRSNSTIEGALEINAVGSGDSAFENNGKMKADMAGEAITLDSSLAEITDTEAVGVCDFYRWEVKGNAALRFGQGASTLAGNFWVGPGRLLLDRSVSTSGGLSIVHGGVIRTSILPPACFFFDGHCASNCPWIPSPVCFLSICP